MGKCQGHCPDAWVTFQDSCYLFAVDAKPFTESEVGYAFNYYFKITTATTNKQSEFQNAFGYKSSTNMEIIMKMTLLIYTVGQGIGCW